MERKSCSNRPPLQLHTGWKLRNPTNQRAKQKKSSHFLLAASVSWSCKGRRNYCNVSQRVWYIYSSSMFHKPSWWEGTPMANTHYADLCFRVSVQKPSNCFPIWAVSGCWDAWHLLEGRSRRMVVLISRLGRFAQVTVSIPGFLQRTRWAFTSWWVAPGCGIFDWGGDLLTKACWFVRTGTLGGVLLVGGNTVLRLPLCFAALRWCRSGMTWKASNITAATICQHKTQI